MAMSNARRRPEKACDWLAVTPPSDTVAPAGRLSLRSEEQTSELQSPCNLVCRLLLEKKKNPALPPTVVPLAAQWAQGARRALTPVEDLASYSTSTRRSPP